MKRIESKDNPRFKDLLRTRKNPEEQTGRVFIEGTRLCMDALASGVSFETVLISSCEESRIDLSQFDENVEIIILSDLLFQKLSSTKTPQGLAAVVHSPVIHIRCDGNWVIHPMDRYLICESVRDPGNLGGILRSADAFGFTGVIITKDTVDPFNEKVLRSSMGSIFHIAIIQVDSMSDTLQWLKDNKVTTYASHLKGTDISREFSFQFPCAIVMGNEGNGLSSETTESCDELIRIPMTGKAESLNVSNAAAVLCYLVSADHTARTSE